MQIVGVDLREPLALEGPSVPGLSTVLTLAPNCVQWTIPSGVPNAELEKRAVA